MDSVVSWMIEFFSYHSFGSFDENFPEGERFPRVFEVVVREVDGQVICEVDGKPAGDPLTDNAYADDGYRIS